MWLFFRTTIWERELRLLSLKYIGGEDNVSLSFFLSFLYFPSFSFSFPPPHFAVVVNESEKETDCMMYIFTF